MSSRVRDSSDCTERRRSMGCMAPAGQACRPNGRTREKLLLILIKTSFSSFNGGSDQCTNTLFTDRGRSFEQPRGIRGSQQTGQHVGQSGRCNTFSGKTGDQFRSILPVPRNAGSDRGRPGGLLHDFDPI